MKLILEKNAGKTRKNMGLEKDEENVLKLKKFQKMFLRLEKKKSENSDFEKNLKIVLEKVFSLGKIPKKLRENSRKIWENSRAWKKFSTKYYFESRLGFKP